MSIPSDFFLWQALTRFLAHTWALGFRITARRLAERRTEGAYTSIKCSNTSNSPLAFCTLCPFGMIVVLPIFVIVSSEREVGPETPCCRAIWKDLKAFPLKLQSILKASNGWSCTGITKPILQPLHRNWEIPVYNHEAIPTTSNDSIAPVKAEIIFTWGSSGLWFLLLKDGRPAVKNFMKALICI